MAKIKKGDKVKVEYTGKFSDGTVFDSSENRPPLCFTVGSGQVIAGFDKAVEGMKLKEKKTFTIPAEEAYGSVRKELIKEIPREKLPAEKEFKVGMVLVLQSPEGRQIPAKISRVDQKTVTIDLNHPLAGKELIFEVKIVGINQPEEGGSSGCSGCSDCV